MCGIAGFVGLGSREDLKRMNFAQASRGPDGDGVAVVPEERLYLGHRRLAVIDIEGGAQPMWSADRRLAIVFNGEIYNHVELRRQLVLAGADFATDHSDTEVLLQGYRIWGDNFVERLNGMWAFVLYDEARRRLFGSRDRFGKKPLYHTSRPGFFAFASELSALLAHPLAPRAISKPGLEKYFGYGYIPAPHSIIDGVAKLPGGYSFSYCLASGALRTWPYWRFELDPDPALPDSPRPADAEELLELLDSAVKCRLIADVPVGVFLSGGIDSTTVAALAARAHTQPVETFSVGFTDPSFDESSYAQLAARQFSTIHHHQFFSEDDAIGIIPEALARLDEPMADSSFLPTWFLCRHARTRVTVALGGDGADELLAGYDPFAALPWAQRYTRWVPRRLRSLIAGLAGRLPVSHRNMSLDFRIKRALRGIEYPPALWAPTWMAPLLPPDIGELLGEPVSDEEVFSEAIDLWQSCRQPDALARLAHFFTRLYLQDDILTKVDRAGMAHSLEVRSPFLDIDVVDYLRRIPFSWKFRNGRGKIILRQAVGALLPAPIVARRKKGFGVPVGKWFREGTLAPDTAAAAWLPADMLAERLRAHRRGDHDDRGFLWCALVLGRSRLSGGNIDSRDGAYGRR